MTGNKHKIAAIAVLLAGGFFLLETDALVSHVFYIPIVLAAVWWRRKGLIVAIFSAAFLILSHAFFRPDVTITDDYFRAFMFVTVAFTVVVLSERITKAREALRESEEKLRAMFESAIDGITVTDLEGNITQANKALARIHGFDSSEEIIGRNAFDYIAKGELDRALKNARKTQREGFIEPVEYIGLKKDGTEFPVELSVAVLKDKEGNSTGFVGITRDITGRKLVEKRLETYRARLRSLASELSKTEQRERRRIATELHDRIGQGLAFTRMKLAELQSSAAARDSEKLTGIRELIDNAIMDTRSLTFELSPPGALRAGPRGGAGVARGARGTAARHKGCNRGRRAAQTAG
jgi:PAS domain S-box-containing protein